MRIRSHGGDELLDDILDQVGPVVADVDVVLLPNVGECLQDLKRVWLLNKYLNKVSEYTKNA